jgi:hypothetical protein
VLAVERLGETAALVRGTARYPLAGHGHGAGNVWWVDELRDGLIWRARGFTSEREARAAFDQHSTSASSVPVSPERQLLVCTRCGHIGNDFVRGWHALVVSDDDELPLRDDNVLVFCPDCAAREFDGD